MKKLILIFTFFLWLAFAHANETQINSVAEAYQASVPFSNLSIYAISILGALVFIYICVQIIAKEPWHEWVSKLILNIGFPAMVGLAVLSYTGIIKDISAIKGSTQEIQEENSEFKGYNEGLEFYNKGEYKKAFDIWESLAKGGDTYAQNNIAVMYENGQGVDKNIKEAIKWYTKAAKQGDATAQYNLGIMYENGEGVIQNNLEARKWYSKAAKQGHALAQYNLGSMYYMGVGVSQNYQEALKWYRKAAKQGVAEAQYNLGIMYRDGEEGVSKNVYVAFNWFSSAAEQGYAGAQNEVAFMYDRGEGVIKNPDEALKWYRKAAEQGLALAQYNLAVMYHNGKNYIKSYMWASIAIANGIEEAKDILQKLNGIMDREYIEKALKMAKPCIESGYEDCGWE